MSELWLCSDAQPCPTLCPLWTAEPTRLLCPWDFPGRNTGVGCHFLLQGIFPAIKSTSPVSPALAGGFFNICAPGKPLSYGCAYSLSRVRLFCNPTDCSPPCSCVHGILRARIHSSFRRFPDPWSNSWSPSLQADSLPSELGWWWWFSHLSCVRLLQPPWTAGCQAPPSLGFSRQEYLNGLPFPSPGDLPNLGIEPGSPASQADSLPTELQGKPRVIFGPFKLATLSLSSFLCSKAGSKWVMLGF